MAAGSYPKIRASNKMRDGSSIGAFVSGDSDADSYVCPAAGVEGGPPGFDPRATAGVVRIDPHCGGPTIRLSSLTNDAIAQATQQTQIRAPGIDVDEWRERGADAFAMAAQWSNAVEAQAIPVDGQDIITMAVPASKHNSRSKPAPQPKAAPAIQPEPIMKTAEVQPMGQAVPYAPMQQPPQAVQDGYQAGNMANPYYQPPQQQPMYQPPAGYVPVQPQPAAPPLPQQPNMQPIAPGQSLFQRTQSPPMYSGPIDQSTGHQPPSAPQTLVEYEIEGFPMKFNGYFHQVIITETTLVLAFDKRSVGYPKQFPPAGIEQHIAVNVLGQPYVHVITAPKHHFDFGNFELCVAEIVSTNPIAGAHNGQVRPNNAGTHPGSFGNH